MRLGRLRAAVITKQIYPFTQTNKLVVREIVLEIKRIVQTVSVARFTDNVRGI